MMRILLLFVFTGFVVGAHAQEKFVKRDLQPAWQVFENNQYQPYDASKHKHIQTIYLQLDPRLYRGDWLEISSVETFALFQQGKLLADQKKEMSISIDSLFGADESPGWFAVHCEEPVSEKELSTRIITNVDIEIPEAAGPLPRAKQAARNFIVAAGMVLLVFFVLILRLNPKLTIYYFSVSKLFALRESDEGQFRVAGSANVLLYVFASLLISFGLMTVALESSSPFKLLRWLQEQTVGGLLLHWLYTAFFVLAALVGKALVTGFFAVLFGIRDQAGFHFLTFIRFILLVGFILAFFVAGHYLVRGASESWAFFFYGSLSWLLIGWSILIFLKLLRRVNFPVFHLFFYLCATELIPFLVIVKVLYE
ncbi:MAG: DUF4271 domain-containing protein [Cyclobacteriaceae bacterium]|nr:DUF4271 domain-containing protein [Cyclobacteriaceae bacterium]